MNTLKIVWLGSVVAVIAGAAFIDCGIIVTGATLMVLGSLGVAAGPVVADLLEEKEP